MPPRSVKPRSRPKPELAELATELVVQVRATAIERAHDWSIMGPYQTRWKLDAAAERYTAEWGAKSIRSLAEEYVDLRSRRRERDSAITEALDELDPLLDRLVTIDPRDMRSRGKRLLAAMKVLQPLVRAEQEARILALKQAKRASALPRKGSAAARARLDSAYGDLPPQNKEWTPNFVFIAYEYGLGPTHVAKLEALVGHGYFPGIRFPVPGRMYIPLGPDPAQTDPKRTATARWDGHFRRLGLHAPPPPRITFSPTDGRPNLGSSPIRT